jgi:hypothetical protein
MPLPLVPLLFFGSVAGFLGAAAYKVARGMAKAAEADARTRNWHAVPDRDSHVTVFRAAKYRWGEDHAMTPSDDLKPDRAAWLKERDVTDWAYRGGKMLFRHIDDALAYAQHFNRPAPKTPKA